MLRTAGADIPHLRKMLDGLTALVGTSWLLALVNGSAVYVRRQQKENAELSGVDGDSSNGRTRRFGRRNVGSTPASPAEEAPVQTVTDLDAAIAAAWADVQDARMVWSRYPNAQTIRDEKYAVMVLNGLLDQRYDLSNDCGA